MILTITLNPAVDYVVFGEGFTVGTTNRGEDIPPDPGGKGNNAARIAHCLGAEVEATGVLGGFTGEFIRDSLDAEGVYPDFYQVPKPTRITASFVDRNDLAQTKIVPFGPPLSAHDIEGFRSHLAQLLKTRHYSIISMNGSMARGMDECEYERLIGICSKAGVPVLLDTSGAPLERVMAPPACGAAPFMIKPNLEEARSMCKAEKSASIERLCELMKPLLAIVPCVALTLGAEGAILLTQKAILHGEIPGVRALNPVCAGDAFVGGFLACWDRKPGSIVDGFKWALAAGSATASVKGLMWERRLFDDLLERVVVRSLA